MFIPIFFSRRKFFSLALALILCASTAVHAAHLPPKPAPSPSSTSKPLNNDFEEQKNDTTSPETPSFTLLTYNTHLVGNSWAAYVPNSTKEDDKRAKKIASRITPAKFDFAGLQEVFDPSYVALFKQKKLFNTIYATKKFDTRGIKWWHHLIPNIVPDGLLLLGKYPIKACVTIPYNDSNGLESAMWKGIICGYVPANVKQNNKPFCIFVTHTHWGGDDKANRAVRMKNISQLRQIIDAYTKQHQIDSYVLLADLNITYKSIDYEELMRIFPECADVTCNGQPTCDPEANQLLRFFHPEYIKTGKTKIDYILYTKKDWRVKESKVMDGKYFTLANGLDLSDHYALCATLAQTTTHSSQ